MIFALLGATAIAALIVATVLLVRLQRGVSQHAGPALVRAVTSEQLRAEAVGAGSEARIRAAAERFAELMKREAAVESSARVQSRAPGDVRTALSELSASGPGFEMEIDLTFEEEMPAAAMDSLNLHLASWTEGVAEGGLVIAADGRSFYRLRLHPDDDTELPLLFQNDQLRIHAAPTDTRSNRSSFWDVEPDAPMRSSPRAQRRKSR